LITTKQAAQIFGVTVRRIDQHVKDGALVRPKPGFVSCESLAALLKKERDEKTEDVADYEADKARKMKADADLAELLTAKEGRKLVEIAKIERRWANALSGLRGKCMAMPARIGPMVVIAKSAGDATKLIESELRDAFDSIADAGPDGGEDDEGEAE
jgi:hypothetical protein